MSALTRATGHRGPLRRARARHGGTVLELLVAMPLALLLSGVAVQLFVTQLRTARSIEVRLHNLRELEHGALAIAADLRAAAAADLETWTDTSVVLHAPVFTGVVCGAPAAHLVDVVAGHGAHPLRAVVFAAPRSGDRLVYATADTALAGAPSAALDSTEQAISVQAVSRASAACARSALHTAAGGTPWRLTVSAGAGEPPDAGSVVSVRRRVEWRAYRAGDGTYWLGRRDWNGTAWATIQPVAGPLLSHRDGGFRLRVTRADGTPVASASEARLVLLELRAARRTPASGLVQDSLRVRLALRGGG